jgi:hypothetical protein
VHFQAHGRGRKALCPGAEPTKVLPLPQPVPHSARLLALALRCEQLVRAGQIRNYAELARLAHVSRARVSQILSLLNLAPAIQEEILFLQGRPRGPGALLLAHVQPIAAIPDWANQRRRWRSLQGRLAALS